MFTDESRFVLQPDDKCVRAWREQGTCNRPQNITKHPAFCSESIKVWARISLGYRQDSVMAVWYGEEILHHIAKLHAAAVHPSFVLMDINVHPQELPSLTTF